MTFNYRERFSLGPRESKYFNQVGTALCSPGAHFLLAQSDGSEEKRKSRKQRYCLLRLLGLLGRFSAGAKTLRLELESNKHKTP